MLRRFALAIVLGLTTACIATTGGFKATMNSWLGGSVNDFIAKNGAPLNTMPLTDGTTAYVWQFGGGTAGNVYWNPYLRQWQSRSVPVGCDLTIIADRESRITSWSARGNACKNHHPSNSQ